MPVRFFVPNLGTALILREDWRFKLYCEHRNNGLIGGMIGEKKANLGWSDIFNADARDKLEEAGHKIRTDKGLSDEEKEDAYRTYRSKREMEYVYCTIPEGTVLTVDRIYVRRGVEAYNSVTFRTHKKTCPDKKLASKRFWAKLQDANNIVCDIVG